MPVGQSDTNNPTIDSKGPLRNSLRVRVKVSGRKVNAQIESRHGLASVHHEGRVETAKAGKPFVFEIDGRTVVTDRVKMPKRPFLQAPLDAEQQAILDMLKDAMVRGYVQS